MSGYLLDTHAAIWWWTDDARLSAPARAAIEAGSDTVAVSAASIWEVAIKSQAGRLPELPAFRDEYADLVAASRFALLSITDRDAVDAAYLDGAHRDPFDRLIAAQALGKDMVVVTRDREIAALGCKVLW